MEELKVSLITESITDKQLDKLDKFLTKEFNSPVLFITKGLYKKEQTNDNE